MQNGPLARPLAQITSTGRHFIHWVLLKVLFEKKIPLLKKVGHIDVFQPLFFRAKRVSKLHQQVRGLL